MQIQTQRILGLKDVIVMTVLANLGIRWIPVAAGMGPISLIFWLLGALLFFVPLALIVSELSFIYPKEGGMYTWTRQGIGERSAFIVAWLYWVNAIFFYPAALTFLAVSFAYTINQPALANKPAFVNTVVLSTLWLLILINIYGIKVNQWLSRFGFIFGVILPVGALVALGFISLMIFDHSATSFSLHNFLPNHSLIQNLSSLSMIMFAMAGVEVVPTFADSVKNPQKTLPRGLLLGSLLIFLLYALGTLAMNFIADPESINKTSGMMETFRIIDTKFHIAWFTQCIGGLLVVADLTAISIWVLAPALMFFSCTPKGILPAKLHKMNRYGVPHNALIFQGILVTIIMCFANFLPSVNVMYEALVLITTVLYFIPYLILAVAYIKIRRPIPKIFLNEKMAWVIGIVTFLSVTLGILLSYMPTADLKTHHAVVVYELELIFGPIIFILLGVFFYVFRTKGETLGPVDK